MKAFRHRHIIISSGRRTLFFLLTILSISGLSQDYKKQFESVLVKDGLAQSAIIDITSDEYGYVWFGTYGGLSRFDGSEFVNFYHDADDSTTLSNSTIWSLKSTGDGYMWAGTSEGLNKYDWSKEHFVQYKNPELFGRKISKIEQWSADTLILETPLGLYFFDVRNEVFFQLPQFDLFKGESVFFQLTKAGNILVYSKGAIHLMTESENNQLDVGDVKAMYSDSNDNIWLVNSKEVRIVSPDLAHIKTVSTTQSGSTYTKITEDEQETIYIINSKLQIFDMDGGPIASYTNDPNSEFSLLANLSAIHIGQDKIWWIGTSGYGVNKYDPNKPTLGLLGQKPGFSPSLSNSYVTSVFSEDDKKILIGTATSLDLYDIEHSSIQKIFPDRVNYLFQENGRYWGATNNALLQIDIQKKKVIRKISLESLGSARTIKAFDNSTLWIASGTGLTKLDLNTETKKTLRPPSDPTRGRNTGDWITSIHKMGDELLLGTSIGLYLMELTSEKFTHITDHALAGLSDSFIKCIEEDKSGIIWIGTSGDGLFRWDPTNNSVEHFTKKDGLPSNVVYGVLQDEKGFLWMSTNYGLSRLDDGTKEFVNLDIGYGLQSYEFNTSAYFKSSIGVFYFGGVRGLNYFNPGSVENPIKPETHITGLYLSNERVSPSELGSDSKAIMDLDTVILNYQQNMLSFDFKSSNFTISKLNQYAYYLENLEEDWNYVGNRRFANYSSLPPGEYIFKVKSSNNSGLWDTTPAQIVIIITEPYWQTTWFKFLIVGIALVLILSVTGLRIRSLKRKEIKLKLLVDKRTRTLQITNEELRKSIEEKENTQQKLIQSEKMAALGTMSAGVGHEINNPLNIIDQALTSLENELDDKGSGNPKKLTAYINFMHEGVRRASQIVKSLSNFSRSGISFDEKCNIESLIDDCIVLLNNKIKYKAKVEKNYTTDGLVIKGNGGKLNQVFFNILSNAVQAIPKQGTISLATYTENDYLIVEISDSGPGIPSENINKIFDPFFTTKEPGEGTGLGLSITHTIIKEHNGSIKVTSELNKGSTFIVSLPLAI